ncbi:C-type lectin 7 [Elysia marginata]|uniref:C-type lectin 7 n=1 Tax=Elysia marginata TaxID=1093978 RepID=A0AAV4JAT2_9GAST|nr:C-type lectin 7 [Elysia marginata]
MCSPKTIVETLVCFHLLTGAYASTSNDTASCPPEWVQSTVYETCVKIFDTEHTWLDANINCSAAHHKAHLVTIPDNVTNQFLYDLVKSKAVPFWIGLIRLGYARDFRWSGGSVPDFLDSNSPICGIINNDTVAASSWTAGPCDDKLPFICEIALGPSSLYSEAPLSQLANMKLMSILLIVWGIGMAAFFAEHKTRKRRRTRKSAGVTINVTRPANPRHEKSAVFTGQTDVVMGGQNFDLSPTELSLRESPGADGGPWIDVAEEDFVDTLSESQASSLLTY